MERPGGAAVLGANRHRLPGAPRGGIFPFHTPPTPRIDTVCTWSGPTAPGGRTVPTLLAAALQRLRPPQSPLPCSQLCTKDHSLTAHLRGQASSLGFTSAGPPRPSLALCPDPQAQVMARRVEGSAGGHSVLCAAARKAFSQREGKWKLQGMHSWLNSH